MRRIQVVRPERPSMTPDARPARRRLIGPARSVAASPPEISIWMDVVLLEPGSGLERDREHDDEAIFVVDGALAVEGRVCPTGGAIVIERGADCRVEAIGETKLLHMGSTEAGSTSAPRSSARRVSAGEASAAGASGASPRVHVVGPRGRFEACEPGRETHFFADATCPTCDVWLLRTGRAFAYESPVHSHSQDELIHVLEGEIGIGSLAVRRGETLFVAADQPYRFRGNAGGFAFLNFRSGPSRMTMRATGERIVENAAATGMTPVLDGVAAG
ncbi:MAG: hypothetical protein R3F35_12195 [Myxococcota bacterium]